MNSIRLHTRIGLAFLVAALSVLVNSCGGGGTLPSLGEPQGGGPLQILTGALQDATSGESFTQKLDARGGTPPYAWSVSSGQLPSGLTLNSSTGTIVGTPDTPGDYSFTVQVKDASPLARNASKKFPLRVHPAAPKITTSSLPDGQVNVAYQATLSATGGKTPYTWSVASGSLPPGLLLTASSGVIAGTPTAAGTFSFTIRVQDSATQPRDASKALTITIADSTTKPLAITTTSLPEGTVGQAYSAQLAATGGAPPYTWSIVLGALPPALSMNTEGAISGTPTQEGTFAATFQAKDSTYAQQKTATASLNVQIANAPTEGFRFVSWGDTKSGLTVLSSLSNQVAPLSPKLTIYTGDLCDSGFTVSCMDNWKNAINGGANNGNFDKTFPVRGNHDASNLSGWQAYYNLSATAQDIGATNYSELNPDVTFSFDIGNSHFVALDALGDATKIASSQISWLDSDLAAAESRGLTHAFLYWHGPTYCVDGHCSCTTRTCAPTDSTIADITNVINKHPIVSASFHGHEHVLAYVHVDNTRIPEVTHPYEEFVTGTAGADLYSCKSYRTDYCKAVNGFATIDVSGTSFTVNMYQQGSTTPLKTWTFTK